MDIPQLWLCKNNLLYNINVTRTYRSFIGPQLAFTPMEDPQHVEGAAAGAQDRVRCNTVNLKYYLPETRPAEDKSKVKATAQRIVECKVIYGNIGI